MKVLITNYTFDKVAKTISFNDYTTIYLENILLITNVTNNIIIYNFADPLAGGVVNNNILTLDYDTSSMNNTDKLQIFYDNGETIASETLLELLRTQIENDEILKKQLFMLLKPLSILGNGTGRLNIDVFQSTATSLQTVTTISANQTLYGLTNFGGLSGFELQKSSAHTTYTICNRNNITF